MREEERILKHIADAAFVRRQEDAGLNVGENYAVDSNPAAVGPQEAGDEIEQRRFAGT